MPTLKRWLSSGEVSRDDILAPPLAYFTHDPFVLAWDRGEPAPACLRDEESYLAWRKAKCEELRSLVRRRRTQDRELTVGVYYANDSAAAASPGNQPSGFEPATVSPSRCYQLWTPVFLHLDRLRPEGVCSWGFPYQKACSWLVAVKIENLLPDMDNDEPVEWIETGEMEEQSADIPCALLELGG